MTGPALSISPNSQDHRRGPLRAPVNILEYGDFQCPFCARAASVTDRLIDEFQIDLCFIYRHFPLRTLHPDAEFAALASEAADQQAQFWPMHHLLFQNQDDLSAVNILNFAEDLELDLQRFQDDLQREDLLQRVRRDFSGGIRSGVNGTPAFYLNGFRFDGPSDFETLKVAIAKSLGSETPGIRPLF